MVIKGDTRGNGRQLAEYLTTMAENEDIRILDVDGRGAMNEKALFRTLTSMSLTSDLTKSQKGLYHAEICPAYEDLPYMDDEKWIKAADMLGEALGLSGQRRVIVMHQKKDRLHAHVVFERYNHDTGKIIRNSFTRLKQNAVRLQMEELFKLKKTPERNQNRPVMREVLNGLWKKTNSAVEFINAANGKGYTVATGTHRPYIVVDRHGRSFNLVRELAGVNTKEVRERFKEQKLPTEKSAIKAANVKERMIISQERMVDKIRFHQQDMKLAEHEKKLNVTEDFADARDDMLAPQPSKQAVQQFTEFMDNNKEIQKDHAAQKRKEEAAQSFAENRPGIIKPNPNTLSLEEKQRIENEALQKLQQNREEKKRKKGKGFGL